MKLGLGAVLPPTVALSVVMALSLLKMQQSAPRALLAFLLQQTRQNAILAMQDSGVGREQLLASSAVLALSLLKTHHFAPHALLAFLLQQTRQNASLAP